MKIFHEWKGLIRSIDDEVVSLVSKFLLQPAFFIFSRPRTSAKESYYYFTNINHLEKGMDFFHTVGIPRALQYVSPHTTAVAKLA